MGREHIDTLRKENKETVDTKLKPFEIKESVGKSVISNDGDKKRSYGSSFVRYIVSSTARTFLRVVVNKVKVSAPESHENNSR